MERGDRLFQSGDHHTPITTTTTCLTLTPTLVTAMGSLSECVKPTLPSTPLISSLLTGHSPNHLQTILGLSSNYAVFPQRRMLQF